VTRLAVAREDCRFNTTKSALMALCIGAVGLASCDMLLSDRVTGLPNDRAWQALPLRAFVTRPTIEAKAMEFCRADRCGYDAAIGRFVAGGGEAAALRASLTDPASLAKLVREPAVVEKAKKAAPPRISIDNFAITDWKGVMISVYGAKRNAFAVVLDRPLGSRLEIILVFTDRAGVARALATSAAAG
jgi:hypothetical protein